jgi:two-component system sensor histidine kinase RegB
LFNVKTTQNIKASGKPIRDPLEALGFRLHNFVFGRLVMLLAQLIFILVMTKPAAAYGVMWVFGLWSVGVIFNSYFWFIGRRGKTLSQREAFFQLTFDVVHLSLLLWAVGGLSSPLVVFYYVAVCVSTLVLLPQLSLKLLVLVSISSGIVAVATDSGFLLWILLLLSLFVVWYYLYKVGGDLHKKYEALVATESALASEERLAALGALSTAAAHELGTPLGTITLAAKEILNDMEEDNPYREDMEVIAQEALRCREKLKQLSTTHADEREDLLRRLPVEALVQLAIDSHETADRNLIIKLQGTGSESGSEQPMVSNRPEIIHGIGNFIENAVGYSSNTIEVHIGWDENKIRISILDDGPGFDSEVVSKLGDPYISTRDTDVDNKSKAGGLGLGVFIAKTLIERTGGEVSFHNSMMGGAQVDIVWPREVFDEIGTSGRDAGGIPWELQ